MDSPQPIDAVLRSIEQAGRLLVTTHARPDGDALGGLLASWMMLQQMGKQADMALYDPVPRIYQTLPCSSRIHHWTQVEGPYDAVLLLECDGVERSRLRGLEKYFLINIDHHVSGRPFGDVNWIDSRACAVAEMVYRLARAARVTISQEMATCLYTAVLSDSGAFCYTGTDAHTLELAADLVRHGADPAAIARNVYFSNPISKVLLLGTALRNLRVDGDLAWLWVTSEDMQRISAAEEDCEGIVNYAISIAGIEVAVFLRELVDRNVRLSLRSKGRIEVDRVAAYFGGGGHASAGGCTLEGPISQATERILARLRSELSLASA